jgi:hypothetical protein
MNAADITPLPWTDVAQAIGSILAVLAGFAYVGFQRFADGQAAAQAAGHLARHSVDRVTERMAALIDPSKPIEFALRGQRAREMIAVMRELDISKLPGKFIEPFATVRSAIYAINHRIDEILLDDTSRRQERRKRLYSSGRILTEARAEMDRLSRLYLFSVRWKMALNPLDHSMRRFLTEAAEDGRKTG